MPIDGDYDAMHEGSHRHQCTVCGYEWWCDDDRCDFSDLDGCHECMFQKG